ncbi:TetR/AcrR family transcriptional regulator C-terminal domain-containing protein [Antrihabitans sp. YC2-6]|uniref:TetR/AcrR family transcriptional regulator C-terminal domain-containing protein n=1 Tax=Antrihabitans sp. YC2-6 TaxID=2799498 RepID=UPI0018F4132A|nr:TetR/AcrR family transcriptional regulator C-terminal domain-containing protein [Antrihabitans sp. YC2-6]MBJ8343168.1 TetR/AcrR family transcriptional regulator C-terminal domain-containing protein [Antrihabitans sp. YC2-6]
MQLRRQDVLDGAIAILDEYGLADLTMRRLASSLKVQPGALYWHFPNKQTLLGAIADTILAPVEGPVAAGTWDAQIVEVARRFRDALLSHRDGAELVSATYASRLTTTHTREKFVSSALRAGMPRADAELAAHAILHYVLGQTVDEQSRMQLDSAGVLAEDASPLFEAPDASARFEFGLQLFIGGVRHRLGNRARA